MEEKKTYGYELRVTLHHCNMILYSSIAVFFIAKPSSIVVFVVQTKWTFNHEGRGHRSLIGVSRGIGRPYRDTLGFSEYNTVHTMLRSICAISNCL